MKPVSHSSKFFRVRWHKIRARSTISVRRSQHCLAVKHIMSQDDLWLELPIERGQIQYLNNAEVAHYRSEFTDHDDPALKRHLVRTWHRDRGQVSYDG